MATELPKVVVENVVFDGPVSLPSSIRDHLVDEIKQSFTVGTEWLEELNEVAIRGAWEDQGFFKMTSTAKAQVISEGAVELHVSVTIHVEEGLQYRLSEIRFRRAPEDELVGTQNSRNDTEEDAYSSRPSLRKKLSADDVKQLATSEPAFPIEELRKSIELGDGDLFRTESIRKGLDALKHLYGAHGYIEFVATPITEVDDSTGTILLTMELNEGKQFYIRTIGVQGLDPQTEGSLRWRIHPGDIFNNELFEDFFTDNKDVLPRGASPRNAEMTKREKSGTVDIRVVLHTCP